MTANGSPASRPDWTCQPVSGADQAAEAITHLSRSFEDNATRGYTDSAPTSCVYSNHGPFLVASASDFDILVARSYHWQKRRNRLVGGFETGESKGKEATPHASESDALQWTDACPCSRKPARRPTGSYGSVGGRRWRNLTLFSGGWRSREVGRSLGESSVPATVGLERQERHRLPQAPREAALTADIGPTNMTMLGPRSSATHAPPSACSPYAAAAYAVARQQRGWPRPPAIPSNAVGIPEFSACYETVRGLDAENEEAGPTTVREEWDEAQGAARAVRVSLSDTVWGGFDLFTAGTVVQAVLPADRPILECIRPSRLAQRDSTSMHSSTTFSPRLQILVGQHIPMSAFLPALRRQTPIHHVSLHKTPQSRPQPFNPHKTRIRGSARFQ
uniref:Uncharacterized protein n=1 Tax=Mycena chlorophos TaxID=658473 RepID=A0ABQ0KZX0_MYCCL|nr:predicted protein [Mycena chlorophos]